MIKVGLGRKKGLTISKVYLQGDMKSTHGTSVLTPRNTENSRNYGYVNIASSI